MLDICRAFCYYTPCLRGSGPKASGGIAQLGERLNGIQEVSGSIPLISTINGYEVSVKSLEIERFRDFFLLKVPIFDPRNFAFCGNIF